MTRITLTKLSRKFREEPESAKPRREVVVGEYKGQELKVRVSPGQVINTEKERKRQLANIDVQN